MARIIFEKTGNAVWISHLDLMRLFQRAFKRAGLPLTHTQGFNPRPSVSIALPLSVGVQSHCELLDFELDGETVNNKEIKEKLNAALVEGVHVIHVYDNGQKLKNLALLSCNVDLEYDNGINENMLQQMKDLFSQESVIVSKKSKNGITEQNIIPMIRKIDVAMLDGNTVRLDAVVCCQNPSLNPMLLVAAIERYLPDCKPDHAVCCRNNLFDNNEKLFR